MEVSPAGNGTVSINFDSESLDRVRIRFPKGDLVNLEAIPAAGARFLYWSGDLSGDNNPNSLIVDCEKTVTAHFSPIEYTLQTLLIGNGSIEPLAGSHQYDEGTQLSITAIPDSGWRFNSWVGDVKQWDVASTSVTMTSNKLIVAKFSEAPPKMWHAGIVVGLASIMTILLTLLFAKRGSGLAPLKGDE